MSQRREVPIVPRIPGSMTNLRTVSTEERKSRVKIQKYLMDFTQLLSLLGSLSDCILPAINLSSATINNE
jgi:hypothetical protein